MNLPPIRLYEFGTTDRWQKAVIRAIEENIVLGEMRTTIEEEGVRTRVHALGTSLVNWYEVEVLRSGERTYVGCRCRAGENAIPCKHIARVFLEKRWLPWPTGILPIERTNEPVNSEQSDPILDAIRGEATNGDRTEADDQRVRNVAADLPRPTPS